MIHNSPFSQAGIIVKFQYIIYKKKKKKKRVVQPSMPEFKSKRKRKKPREKLFGFIILGSKVKILTWK